MLLYFKSKSIRGNTPFHFLCRNGSVRIVKLFLDNEKKLNVNAQDDGGWTPLHCASRYNNALVVKQLLNHGLDVTLRTQKNSLIIHLGAVNKDPKVIEALFESKQLTNIEKNVTNQSGYTVLHCAAQNDYSHEPLDYLLKNAMKFNLNISKFDNFQGNVFHSACAHGTKATVKFLIQNAEKYNIDLNLRNINGSTPFHHACFFGQLQIVEILLKKSKQYKINIVTANNNLKDGHGLAKQKGHTDVVKLIIDWIKWHPIEVARQILFEIHNELRKINNELLLRKNWRSNG